MLRKGFVEGSRFDRAPSAAAQFGLQARRLGLAEDVGRQELPRSHDAGPAVRSEDEKVLVAGDEHVRISIDRCGEDDEVFGIPKWRIRCVRGSRNMGGPRAENLQEIRYLLIGNVIAFANPSRGRDSNEFSFYRR